MAKTVSYGVLVFNDEGQLLIAHITGTQRWDIPKGGADPGETPIEAAVRETWEETGIALSLAGLTDLGRHAYLPQKDLHLFRCLLPAAACDLAVCRCTSFFPHHRTGKPTPEVDAFQWVDTKVLDQWCSPKLLKVIAPLVSKSSGPLL